MDLDATDHETSCGTALQNGSWACADAHVLNPGHVRGVTAGAGRACVFVSVGFLDAYPDVSWDLD